MLHRKRGVWTLGRKLMGNVLPLLIAVPFLVVGVKDYPATGLTGSTLLALVLFPLVGWAATNLLGNSGSWGLRSVLTERLKRERPGERTPATFVGFARPGYQGLLDPHEDVGLLLVHDDRIEFYGSAAQVELSRADVTSVTFRRNPHAWLGLGRWVSVEGQVAGKPVRLQVEPREEPTLLRNKKLGAALKESLSKWAASASDRGQTPGSGQVPGGRPQASKP